MAVTLAVSVEGLDKLQDRLNGMSPRKNPAWVSRALVKSAALTQRIAAKQMIIQGSRFRGPKGPRGGKGKMMSAGTHPRKLTSRHGGSGIVGSIRVNRSPLPWAIEVGSDKAYAHVHEVGGTFRVPSYMRTIVQSTRSGAASVARVRAHTRRYPQRPYLKPGLEKASQDFERIFAKEWAKEMP
jgi:hypothetical protein